MGTVRSGLMRWRLPGTWPNLQLPQPYTTPSLQDKGTHESTHESASARISQQYYCLYNGGS